MSRAAALIVHSSRVVGITLVRRVGSTEVWEFLNTMPGPKLTKADVTCAF